MERWAVRDTPDNQVNSVVATMRADGAEITSCRQKRRASYPIALAARRLSQVAALLDGALGGDPAENRGAPRKSAHHT